MTEVVIYSVLKWGCKSKTEVKCMFYFSTKGRKKIIHILSLNSGMLLDCTVKTVRNK